LNPIFAKNSEKENNNEKQIENWANPEEKD